MKKHGGEAPPRPCPPEKEKDLKQHKTPEGISPGSCCSLFAVQLNRKKQLFLIKNHESTDAFVCIKCDQCNVVSTAFIQSNILPTQAGTIGGFRHFY